MQRCLLLTSTSVQDDTQTSQLGVTAMNTECLIACRRDGDPSALGTIVPRYSRLLFTGCLRGSVTSISSIYPDATIATLHICESAEKVGDVNLPLNAGAGDQRGEVFEVGFTDVHGTGEWSCTVACLLSDRSSKNLSNGASRSHGRGAVLSQNATRRLRECRKGDLGTTRRGRAARRAVRC